LIWGLLTFGLSSFSDSSSIGDSAKDSLELELLESTIELTDDLGLCFLDFKTGEEALFLRRFFFLITTGRRTAF